MQRPKIIVLIATAVRVGVITGTLATPASAQPTTTRELDSAVRGDRYAERFSVSFGAGDFQAVRIVVPAIPDGKKLLLQSVSVQTVLTHSQTPYDVHVRIFQGIARNALPPLYVDMDFQAAWLTGEVSSRQRFFTGNRDINMVVNAGESFSMTFYRNGTQGLPRRNFNGFTLIGYFVDVDPQAPPAP